MSNIPLSKEIRAEALARVSAGESLASIAESLNISKTSVIKWRDQEGLGKAKVLPQTKEEIGEIIVRLLMATLEGTTAIAELAKDAEWIRGQNARDLAILYGVFNDKAIRLLSAFRQDSEDTE